MLNIPTGDAVLALTTMPAAAQADRNGTSTGPLATARASNVTTTGRAKPPSGVAGQTSQSNIDRRTANDTAQEAVTKGIRSDCTPNETPDRARPSPGPHGGTYLHPVAPRSPGVATRQPDSLYDVAAFSYSPAGHAADGIATDPAAAGNEGRPSRVGSTGGGGGE